MPNKGSFPLQFPELRDRDWLYEHYIVRRLRGSDIASLLGCSRGHVTVALQAVGIEQHLRSLWKVGDEGRICISCEEFKPWPEFYRSKGSKATGHMSACKSCERGKYSPEVQKRLMLAKFGLTLEEFTWLLDQQGGKCALCLHAESRIDPRWPQTVWSLAVDHDHSHCGKNRACKQCIRGLLCGSCNTMLGRVELSGPPLTLRFLDYLDSRPFLAEGGDAGMLSASGDLIGI